METILPYHGVHMETILPYHGLHVKTIPTYHGVRVETILPNHGVHIVVQTTILWWAYVDHVLTHPLTQTCTRLRGTKNAHTLACVQWGLTITHTTPLTCKLAQEVAFAIQKAVRGTHTKTCDQNKPQQLGWVPCPRMSYSINYLDANSVSYYLDFLNVINQNYNCVCEGHHYNFWWQKAWHRHRVVDRRTLEGE